MDGEDFGRSEESPAGRWLECAWNVVFPQGKSPHPDDAATIARLFPDGWISAQCVAVEEPYFVLLVKDTQFRIRPFGIGFREPPPRHKHGDIVQTALGPQVKTSLTAAIRTPQWHMKNDEWTYFLEGSSKRRWRRYREVDLVLVERWSP